MKYYLLNFDGPDSHCCYTYTAYSKSQYLVKEYLKCIEPIIHSLDMVPFVTEVTENDISNIDHDCEIIVDSSHDGSVSVAYTGNIRQTLFDECTQDIWDTFYNDDENDPYNWLNDICYKFIKSLELVGVIQKMLICVYGKYRFINLIDDGKLDYVAYFVMIDKILNSIK